MLMKDGWFFEDDMPFATAIKTKGSLYSKKSKYQNIEILDTVTMGNLMLLDGKTMVSEKDEFYYHESIVHPAVSIHPCPKKIMVVGGGDGGTVREALKYKSVEDVELVEIDEEVINVSKKYFPEIACELNNPKLKIKLNDAIEYMKNAQEKSYDVILCDSTDPEGFAAGLISKEFYKNASRALKEDGIYICQSGSLLIQENEFKMSLENIRTAFKYVDAIISMIPIYPGCMWSFLIASNKPLDKKIKNMPSGKTKYWNDEIHEKLFAKPEWIKEKYFSLQAAK